jgi:hypothetical protein
MKPRLLSDLRSFDARRVRWDLLFFLGRRSDAWYQSLFRAGSSRVTGEITPEYALLSADEVGRVRDAFPHLRILYLMRDPIDRAWSNMRMLARLRGLSLDSEGVALTLAGDPMVVARGDYRETLDAWSRHFPPDRIFTGFMEEVRSDPRALLTRIFDFLGVATDDSVLTPDLYRIVHGGAPKPIPAIAEARPAGMGGRCIQEGGKRALALELVGAFEQRREQILHHVERGGVATEQRAGASVHERRVASIHVVELGSGPAHAFVRTSPRALGSLPSRGSRARRAERRCPRGGTGRSRSRTRAALPLD